MSERTDGKTPRSNSGKTPRRVSQAVSILRTISRKIARRKKHGAYQEPDTDVAHRVFCDHAQRDWRTFAVPRSELPMAVDDYLSQLPGSGHLQDEVKARARELGGKGPVSFDDFVRVVTGRVSTGLEELKRFYEGFPQTDAHRVEMRHFEDALNRLIDEQTAWQALAIVNKRGDGTVGFTEFVECCSLPAMVNRRISFGPGSSMFDRRSRRLARMSSSVSDQ